MNLIIDFSYTRWRFQRIQSLASFRRIQSSTTLNNEFNHWFTFDEFNHRHHQCLLSLSFFPWSWLFFPRSGMKKKKHGVFELLLGTIFCSLHCESSMNFSYLPAFLRRFCFCFYNNNIHKNNAKKCVIPLVANMWWSMITTDGHAM